MRSRGVTVLALALWATAALAVAPAPRTLIVRGRVSDPDGAPIAGAKILRSGAREPAAASDGDGRYAFTCEIGSFAALARAPFRDWFRASCEGWRFAAPAGGDGLALELRVAPGADGTPRLRVRSNDARTAAVVARALAAPGGTVAVLALGFTGRRGQEGRAREPKLTAAIELPVALEDAAAVTVAPPAPGPAQAAVAPPVREPTRAGTTPPTCMPAAAVVADTPAVKAPAVAPERFPERPERLKLFPSAPEAGPRAGRVPVERIGVADTAATSPARHGTAKGEPEGVPSALPPVAPASGDTGAGRTDIRIRVSGDSAGGAHGGRAPGSPIRVRSGRAVPEPDSAPAAHGRCTCTIQGTVELRSEKPLASPLRVEVLLGTERAPRDTVELFMGAPRPFEIREVPCGRSRLALRWPATRRFAVVSKEALEPFECAADRTVLLRVVLEPR